MLFFKKVVIPRNTVKITLLHGCFPVNLLYIWRKTEDKLEINLFCPDWLVGYIEMHFWVHYLRIYKANVIFSWQFFELVLAIGHYTAEKFIILSWEISQCVKIVFIWSFPSLLLVRMQKIRTKNPSNTDTFTYCRVTWWQHIFACSACFACFTIWRTLTVVWRRKLRLNLKTSNIKFGWIILLVSF